VSTTIKVSQLPAAVTPLAGDEEVMIVQSGTSRRTTTADIGSLLSGTLGVAHGGTGLTSFAQGDLIYATGATTLAALAKNATATRYLSNTGTSNAPAWSRINLANGVSGALPIANGGTGQATANSALNALLPDQSGQSGNILTTDGTDTFWSAGSGGAVAPDVVFIADTVGVGAEGYSNFGTTGGTLIFQSARISSTYGFSGYSLLSVAPSEMEFRVEDAEVSQNWFTSLAVAEWGQTFDSADANFSNPGGDSLWHWTSAEAEFVPEGQYTIRLSGDPA